MYFFLIEAWEVLGLQDLKIAVTSNFLMMGTVRH